MAKKSTSKKQRKPASRPLTLRDRLAADESLFTIKEIGQLAGYSRTKIGTDRKAGLLVTIKRGSRDIRATAAAVRSYLALEQTDDAPDPRTAHLPHQKKDAAPPAKPPRKADRPSQEGA